MLGALRTEWANVVGVMVLWAIVGVVAHITLTVEAWPMLLPLAVLCIIPAILTRDIVAEVTGR